MDLRHLATFQAVVRAGSFLGAARALRCAQSTVTVHVQRLEADLGLALFAREGKRAALTEAGRLLAEHGGRLLDRAAEVRGLMAEVAGGEGGVVRLGAIEPTASLRLPPLLARYCAARPRVRLALEVGGTRTVATLVAEGDLDAAVCSPPPARLGLAFEPLFAETLACLVPEGHPLAGRGAIEASDLAGERLLLTDRGCAYRDAIERGLQARGTIPWSGVEIGSLLALREAVASGLGVALVPAAMGSPPPAGTRLRPLAGLDLALPVGLVRRADAGAAGPALEGLLAMLRAALSAATAPAPAVARPRRAGGAPRPAGRASRSRS